MTLIPQRTVVSQIAMQLQEEIRRGVWQEWLPNERFFCEKLQVSRSTLRQALKQLRANGVIETRHGVGHRIASRPTAPPATRPRSIGLLLPDPLEPVARFRPSLAFWIDELKEQIHEFGCELHIIHGRSYYQGQAERALQRLLERESHDGWILALTTPQIQQFFMENRVPCVVAGSLHAGIELPSVDLNYHAICYHAVGELIRLRHRRIVLLIWQSGTPGVKESEKGFFNAVENSGRHDLHAEVIFHRGTMDSISATLNQLLSRQSPPTGIIVIHATWYLAAASLAMQRGIRIPHDLSLICHEHEPFLDFLAPSPARYSQSPHVFTKRLLNLALQLAEGRKLSPKPVRLIPDFTPGHSLGPAPHAVDSPAPIPHAHQSSERNGAAGSPEAL